MKKAERILGISAVSLFLLGICFKFQHWPGASISMSIALVLFNFGYLPLNLFRRYQLADAIYYRIYLIFKFIVFFILMAGFMFAIQHWPGGSTLRTIGNYTLPLFIAVYFFMRFRNQGSVPFSLDDLIIAIIAYGIHMYITMTLISPGVMEGYVIIDEQFTTLNSGIESANGLIYESLDSLSGVDAQPLTGSVKSLRSASEKVCSMIDSLRREFLRYSTDYLLSGNEELSYFGSRFLAQGTKGDEFFVAMGNGERLEYAIDRYTEKAAEIAETYNLKSSLIGNGLGTEGYTDEWGTEINWSEKMFKYLPIAAVFTNLSWIRQMVLLTESTVLNGLISQMDLSEETLLLQELALRESDRAINQKEDEILRIRQQQELQQLQLEKSKAELDQRKTLTVFAFIGIAFVLILFVISTRAYVIKQKDHKKLAEQRDEILEKNEELNQQNEEIAAQRDEIEAQRDLVYKQKEQIERTHNEISASIDYATRLQASILPGPGLLKEQFSDHFILFRPRDKVSGDFYWWSRQGEQVVVAAADCTGHGVPGAFMSMLGISLLSEIVNKEFITHPGRILGHLREEVIRSLNQAGSKGEQKDGMDLSLVNINTVTRKCLYAGANSPLYLVRDHKLQEIKPDMMPVSFYQRMDAFTTHEIQLVTGDQLYLFSDGYADQFGGEDRKKLKYKAFKALLVDHSGEPMAQQHQILQDTITRWQGDLEQIDDMVVIGIKV